MRAFSFMLAALYTSLSFTPAASIPHPLHRHHHRLDSRALFSRPKPPSGGFEGRPLVEVPGNKPVGGFSRRQIQAIIDARIGRSWKHDSVGVYTADNLPKDLTKSFILKTESTEEQVRKGADRFIYDMFYPKRDMPKFSSARNELDRILDENNPKSLKYPPVPAGPFSPTIRQYYFQSGSGRIQARIEALNDQLYGTGKNPSQEAAQEGRPVVRGFLGSLVSKLPRREKVRHLQMMNAIWKEVQGKDSYRVNLHHGSIRDSVNIPPDQLIMAPQRTTGTVLKSLYTDFQTWVKPWKEGIGWFLRDIPNMVMGKPAKLYPGMGAPSRKRQVVQDIGSAENGATVGVTNSSADISNEFELYYSAFLAVQANATATILPFLDALLNNTNSSLLYNAAWSIWDDLTGEDEHVAGPFFGGMHCIDQLEDDFRTQNNLSTDSPDYRNFLAVNGILIEAYQTAWNQSMAALQQNGLADQLATLASFMDTNETGIQPADFATYEGIVYDDRYFIVGNGTS